jgi:hypothetical protein
MSLQALFEQVRRMVEPDLEKHSWTCPHVTGALLGAPPRDNVDDAVKGPRHEMLPPTDMVST